ncbi:MAG: hypothetical protein HFJ84_11030 [Clostridiales bacterium]|nr:hypothetical protein [Clostridiales bacterium]
MSDYKFDTFYYSEDQSSEHYLIEIEKLTDDDYNQLYRGKMYCPWCKKPQLSLVKNGTKSFLRTYPKQYHIAVGGEMCPYVNNTASTKVVEEYIQEIRKCKKIKNLLESTMRRLFKLDMPISMMVKGEQRQPSNPLLIEKPQNDKIIKKGIIPHYSFKSWGENLPQDQLLIVYGKVYIEVKDISSIDKEGNAIIQKYIHFKDIKSRKLITSCRKPNEIELREGNYYAVILGKCHKKEIRGYTYYNLWINFPVEESILLKPFPS